MKTLMIIRNVEKNEILVKESLDIAIPFSKREFVEKSINETLEGGNPIADKLSMDVGGYTTPIIELTEDEDENIVLWKIGYDIDPDHLTGDDYTEIPKELIERMTLALKGISNQCK